MKIVKVIGRLSISQTFKRNTSETTREVLGALLAGVVGFVFITLLMSITN